MLQCANTGRVRDNAGAMDDSFPAWLPTPAWEPMPGWLEQPLALVLADLALPDGISLNLRFGRDAGGAFISVLEPGRVEFGSFPISGEGADLLCAIASGLTDQLAETFQSWGGAHPPCPGHTHPMLAEVIDGRAWWRCPATGTAVAELGTLAGR